MTRIYNEADVVQSTLVEEACWILAWGRSIKKAPRAVWGRFSLRHDVGGLREWASPTGFKGDRVQ